MYLFASYCFLLGRAPFYIILLFAGTCTFLHHIAFCWGVHLSTSYRFLLVRVPFYIILFSTGASTSYCFLLGRVPFYIILLSTGACTFLHHTAFCKGVYFSTSYRFLSRPVPFYIILFSVAACTFSFCLGVGCRDMTIFFRSGPRFRYGSCIVFLLKG